MELARNQVISHRDACALAYGAHLTKGMNFRLKGKLSVFLMSVRNNAPYSDSVRDDGLTLIYEGHNVPRNVATPIPQVVDQELGPVGRRTENGKFFDAAAAAQSGERESELVVVLEKLKKGVWSFNGVYELVAAWPEQCDGRRVYKFELHLSDASVEFGPGFKLDEGDLAHDRIIPTDVKVAVWNRDRGRCIECGATDNLHFDHVIPFSKGGSSLTSSNVQLLCMRHNLEKSDRWK